jgi:hypothetical protein
MSPAYKDTCACNIPGAGTGLGPHTPVCTAAQGRAVSQITSYKAFVGDLRGRAAAADPGDQGASEGGSASPGHGALRTRCEQPGGVVGLQAPGVSPAGGSPRGGTGSTVSRSPAQRLPAGRQDRPEPRASLPGLRVVGSDRTRLPHALASGGPQCRQAAKHDRDQRDRHDEPQGAAGGR